MGIPIILGIANIVGGMGKEIFNGMNPTEYSQAMEKMCSLENCDADFDMRRNLILNSKEFSDAEKNQKLSDLTREREDYHKQAKTSSAEQIKENRKNQVECVNALLLGFMSGGVTCIPSLVGKNKKDNDKINDEIRSDTSVA